MSFPLLLIPSPSVSPSLLPSLHQLEYKPVDCPRDARDRERKGEHHVTPHDMNDMNKSGGKKKVFFNRSSHPVNMNSVLLALSLFLILVSVSPLRFKDCGTTVRDLGIQISGCRLSDDYCPLVIGSNVTMTARFTVTKRVDTATVKLYGKLGPVTKRFPLQPEEACGNWAMNCPVPAGQSTHLVISVAIESHWKPIKLAIRLELWNKNSKLICKQFPVKVVRRLSQGPARRS